MGKEEKEVKPKYSLRQVPTQTTPIIFADETPISLEEALVELLNKLETIGEH